MPSSRKSRAGLAIARSQSRKTARKSKLENAADAYLAGAGFDEKGREVPPPGSKTKSGKGRKRRGKSS